MKGVTKIWAPEEQTYAFNAGAHKWYTNPLLEIEARSRIVDTDVKLSNYLSIPLDQFRIKIDKLTTELDFDISLEEVATLETSIFLGYSQDENTFIIISICSAITVSSCLATCLLLRRLRKTKIFLQKESFNEGKKPASKWSYSPDH